MAINAQSGVGGITLFNDFFGVSDYLALTADTAPLGDFFAGGEGFEDAGAGIASETTDGLSGVVKLTSGATDTDTVFIGTNLGLDVTLMAPIIVEARVRFTDLDAKAAFIGLTSVLTVDEIMTDIIDGATGTTLTLTAGSLAGFYYSSELTDDEDWHMVFNGGTTTGQTTSSSVDADDDAIAGEFQILRLEVDPNGTARYYIDGVLKQTTTGAISLTTNLAVCCGVAANASEAAVMDVDYLLVKANRDWNA